MKGRIIRISLMPAQNKYKITHVCQVIRTDDFEVNTYDYKVVHIDDQDVLLENISNIS